MLERFTMELPAQQSVTRRSHVGVVASGDLEVLLEPADTQVEVDVVTNVAGHRKTWEAVLARFFAQHPVAVRLEIRDHGATPGVVWLRLEQALEQATQVEVQA
ncbi:malonate decarboxylase acyl carrier protein [Granulicella cerasi]|uniref:Malonate decarboxylase acyl carrier protein n=1 Tax=Granulicella cerasi TaxID=741063 RepID=A0ABW1Z8X1_9BACT|nr:malonate decarboxylase acyl carrier protein [Granulicella cerasi]